MAELPEGWKRYDANAGIMPFAICFYQKRIQTELFRQSIEIVEYPQYRHNVYSPEFEVQVYIDSENSPVGKSIKIEVYTYDTLDFERMERDARKILSLAGIPQK